MTSANRCFICQAKAFDRLLQQENLSFQDKKNFTREMTTLYNKSTKSFSAPIFARDLHALLKGYTNNRDPYALAKRLSNDLVLSMYPQLKQQILRSENPFNMALRMAIAGNIMDFAICPNFDVPATIDKVQNGVFAIDHTGELKQALSKAKTVLYLGDNCGEIVFDRLFIETIMHPDLHFAVRGATVTNDATLEDAQYVGMEEVADVISNGYDAPSTILPSCSKEFQSLFERADVIISKGQGNLEGLLGSAKKEVYFLLMVKCQVMAELLNVKKGEFVVKKNSTFQ